MVVNRSHSFAITVFCVILGIVIRIAYCIQYPVQPRDAYSYGYYISQWEIIGEPSPEITFIPFSLWLLKIPHHLFQCDPMKGGVIINLLLGLFMIIITINTLKPYFKDNLTLLFAGLIVASHPTLVRFSCSCLRENTYLFFSFLAFSSLARYCNEPHSIFLFIASISGALSFLCRLEGLETLPVIHISLFYLCIFKRIRVQKALLHGFIASVIFFLTAIFICYCWNIIFISSDQIAMRFQL